MPMVCSVVLKLVQLVFERKNSMLGGEGMSWRDELVVSLMKRWLHGRHDLILVWTTVRMIVKR